jgi:spermidine synthase
MSDGLDPDGKRFIEWAHPGSAGSIFGVDALIEHKRTAYQDLLLFENAFWGKVLVLDGAVQLTERDEFFYHESLAHPALLAQQHPQKVLIVGGGDGALAEEVLKHPVHEVTLVEIDPDVVDIAKSHLSTVHRGAFADPRLRVVIEDAALFIKKNDTRYDAILVDITDPGGPSAPLYEPATLESLAAHLAPRACLALQIGRYFHPDPIVADIIRHVRSLFGWSAVYAAPTPTYPGGMWRFFIGSDAPPNWRTDAVATRLAALPDLRWLPSMFHPLTWRF